jgi:hypothetical protein
MITAQSLVSAFPEEADLCDEPRYEDDENEFGTPIYVNIDPNIVVRLVIATLSRIIPSYLRQHRPQHRGPTRDSRASIPYFNRAVLARDRRQLAWTLASG